MGVVAGLRSGVDAGLGVIAPRVGEDELIRRTDCGRLTVLGGNTSSSVVSPWSATGALVSAWYQTGARKNLLS